MTPGARIAAAIAILDDIGAGQAAEQALLRWARRSRFAGSGDRAAVRDLVFDALRNWQSDAIRGGGETGRLRMLGRLRAQEADPDTFFTGQGHAPAPLSETERASGTAPSGRAGLDVPDWLWPELEASLGDRARDTAELWKTRAPVSLRVNRARATRDAVAERLASEGIATRSNPLSETALTVTSGARRVRQSPLFTGGLIEMQDASSQAVVDALPMTATALDYCAGGGGKALAMAARGMRVTAHDSDPDRMADVPSRAARAGVSIEIAEPGSVSGAYDLVLCDVPCSGSGAWRRSPEAKWALTPDKLSDLNALQSKIIMEVARFVRSNGVLSYTTCSVLSCENQSIVDVFLARTPGWTQTFGLVFDVTADGDGFYTAHLQKSD